MNSVKAGQDDDTFGPIPGVVQRLYLVEVTQQGIYIASHTIVAPNALAAINLVESYYSEPVKIERALVEDEAGDRRQVTVITNWHGYMFQAQAIGPAVETTAFSQQARDVATA